MEHIDVSADEINQAVSVLRAGGLIAFPTETYYGLGVDPFNESALKRLFLLKNRPSVKPVLVLVPTSTDIALMTDSVPAVAKKLMDRFWPGPLTMVFPAREELSEILTGGTGTIGVRLSPHPVANTLLDVYNAPLTATSANPSGRRAAASEEEVREFFGDEIDMILPGGRTAGKKPSTLIGFSNTSIVCIREGCIPCSEIMQTVQTDV